VVHVDNEASAKVARNNGMFLDKTTVSHGAPVNVFRIKIS
jgi:predicted acetyltransferase